MDRRIKLTCSLSSYFYSLAEFGDLDTCRTGQPTYTNWLWECSIPASGWLALLSPLFRNQQMSHKGGTSLISNHNYVYITLTSSSIGCGV